MQITEHLTLAILLVMVFLSLKYCVMQTVLKPVVMYHRNMQMHYANLQICKFGLCYQPSQLFIIRDINFSDPLLNLRFIKRSFHPTTVFRIYHVPKLQREVRWHRISTNLT